MMMFFTFNVVISFPNLPEMFSKDHPPDIVAVGSLLNADEFKGEYFILLKHRQKLFPFYLQILKDKSATEVEIARIYCVLSAVKGDRRQFRDLALKHLGHAHHLVRASAVTFLSQVGSQEVIAPVVALLSDKDWTTAIAAAKTLAAIGDERALAAMDVWLNSSIPSVMPVSKLQEVVRQRVKKYRDELKMRLEKLKGSKK